MASVNFNPFGNWFEKSPNQIPPLNVIPDANIFFQRPQSAGFASIGMSNLFKGGKKSNSDSQDPTKYKQMAEQFFWECENLPDYGHTTEVEKILNEDPIWETKQNPTKEEIEENERWWKAFRASPVTQFLARALEIQDEIHERELKRNEKPYRPEDRKLWRAVPLVEGPDGRPMPRKAIRSRRESDDKFWDFMKQFLFGLWGFRQRPYPPGRPIDVAQAIGYKRLEQRYYDFIMRCGSWYYKDRLGRTRGPSELITLKTAWGAGIIDEDTFVWGDDMDEWAPIHMVYGLEKAIATWEVRLGAAAITLLHKLQKGIPPWVPLKGREPKTYKQLQEEAVESKKRDLAVLEANNGVWPGVRIPSHALFLWASGSEMTSLLDSDHMPNKFIPKDLRRRLAEVIPGLRPWEVLSVEQAMDQITYGGEWYRDPLGTNTTGPEYIEEWNDDTWELCDGYSTLNKDVYEKLVEDIPGFDKVMERVQANREAKEKKRAERKAQEKMEEEISLIHRRGKRYESDDER